MPRESFSKRTLRTNQITGILKDTYPDVVCTLIHTDPLQLLIATILSAQCTDKRVNIVTPTLFAHYPTAADFAQSDQEELEQEIHSTGFFRNKAKNIRGACERIVSEFGGQVPQTMPQLLSLPGVARKTANVVLSNAFGVNVGVVVDTHVKRLSGKLALSKETNPDKIEQDLMKLVGQEDWGLFSHLLVFHGRAFCKARKPDCPNCPINHLCPSAEI